MNIYIPFISIICSLLRLYNSFHPNMCNFPSESPLPPPSLTSVPSDTSIYLMWFHSDECFENCTFMYEVTWQQSGDGSSLRNTTTTETSYTIEDLTPGTSYEIGIGAYCKEDPSVRSEIRNSKTTLCKCL